MAYKRYVHKKGKRHGPYYYKNIRDEGGRVKSIYLGKATQPSNKLLKATIILLAVLLIIVSSLFFLQNKSIISDRIVAEESTVPFEIDQILIRVLVKKDEFLEKELRVMNLGNNEKVFRVEAIGLSGITDVLDNEFIIKPGQTKIVRLNFSSFNKAERIEHTPGVYIGKISIVTDYYEKSVPTIIEIESKNVLFDMNLNPISRDMKALKILQGSSETMEIRLFNLQSIESFNVDMEYFVKDIIGNTIISEKDSVVVKTQASFFKTIKIPQNIKPGNYIFIAQASVRDSIGTTSYFFEVEETEKGRNIEKFVGFCRNDPLCWALSIIILLLIGACAYFFIGVYTRNKLFGRSMSKAKRVEETVVGIGLDDEKEPQGEIEKPVIEIEKKSSIVKFFRNWKKRRQRAKEIKQKRKLRLENERLKLKEKEERLRIKLQKEEQKLNAARLMEKARELEEQEELRREHEEERKRKKGEEQKARELEEKKKIEEEEQKARELEEKRQEKENRKQEELELKRKEDEERKKEVEIKRKNAEKIKEQKEKNRKLDEIKRLGNSISEKDSKISELNEKNNVAISYKEKISNTILQEEKNIESFKKEKNVLFRIYNESLKDKDKIEGSYNSKLSSWKNRHNAKIEERKQIEKDVKEDYNNELKKLESRLQHLSDKERKQQEKWKKLELKAKYKLEEQKRNKAVMKEIKEHLREKEELKKEFDEKNVNVRKLVLRKDIIQRQKEIDKKIKESEKSTDEANKKIRNKENTIVNLKANIEKLNEEKEKIKDNLRERKKELGGFNYIQPLFRFAGEKNAGKGEERGRKDENMDVGEEEKESSEKFEEKEHDLEKSLKDLAHVFEQKKKEKKPGIIKTIIQRKKQIDQEKIKTNKENEKKRKGKSGKFTKCHKLLLKADSALQNNDKSKARNLYKKVRSLYTKLEYAEKKDIYNELMELYNRISK